MPTTELYFLVDGAVVDKLTHDRLQTAIEQSMDEGVPLKLVLASLESLQKWVVEEMELDDE